MSPKGATYITVGSGGFSYRKTLSSESHPVRPSHVETAPIQPPADEIKTADVQQLLASSKSELVDTLNRRAQMFNPAILLFILATICAVLGIALLGSSPSAPLPSLPDVSSLADTGRQSNRTDEYALMLARYGQPSEVTLTNAGSAPVRLGIWNAIHLGVLFVPAGCVDAYAYAQAHKSDPPPTHLSRRRRGHDSTDPTVPRCTPLPDHASTIVGYEDVATGSPVDSFAVDRAFASLNTRSEVQPTVKSPETSQAKKGATKINPPAPEVAYDEATLQSEKRRFVDQDDAGKRAMKQGALCLGAALLILLPAIFVHRRNKEKRTTRLVYELSTTADTQQQNLDQAVAQLGSSRTIWRIDSQSAVFDWKRNAGASSSVNRHLIYVRRGVPPRVESNVQPMYMDLGKLKLFFLPDQILYWQRGTFASIEYSDLKLDTGSIRFIEEQVQASDSRQVGSTWRYVRKDGGPDRRFNNNRQLPIMLYGVVNVASSGGLNLLFHTSNLNSADSFSTAFRSFQRTRAHGFDPVLPHAAGQSSNPHHAVDAVPVAVEAAMAILGVKPEATLDEAATAYRHMAQMYHPDKTLGLGPELQKLADERMKEINAAHQIVKRYLEGI